MCIVLVKMLYFILRILLQFFVYIMCRQKIVILSVITLKLFSHKNSNEETIPYNLENIVVDIYLQFIYNLYIIFSMNYI